MGTLTLGAAPAAPATFEHAGGDDEDGCISCWLDQEAEGSPIRAIRPCRQPEDDPDEPGICRWCSHTVEATAAPASLPCPDCENASCRCVA